MSVTDKKLTFNFVESYKKKHPKVPRPDLRRMIILELKISQRSAEDRRLDRYLKKLFDTDLQQLKIIEELKNNLEKFEWVAKYLHLSELLETEEDYQMLYDLIEKLEMIKNQESLEEDQKSNAEISKEIDQDKIKTL